MNLLRAAYQLLSFFLWVFDLIIILNYYGLIFNVCIYFRIAIMWSKIFVFYEIDWFGLSKCRLFSKHIYLVESRWIEWVQFYELSHHSNRNTNNNTKILNPINWLVCVRCFVFMNIRVVCVYVEYDYVYAMSLHMSNISKLKRHLLDNVIA